MPNLKKSLIGSLQLNAQEIEHLEGEIRINVFELKRAGITEQEIAQYELQDIFAKYGE